RFVAFPLPPRCPEDRLGFISAIQRPRPERSPPPTSENEPDSGKNCIASRPRYNRTPLPRRVFRPSPLRNTTREPSASLPARRSNMACTNRENSGDGAEEDEDSARVGRRLESAQHGDLDGRNRHREWHDH